MDTTQPLGAKSGYKFGIADPVALDPKQVVEGSVLSWQKGNFGATLDTLFPNIDTSGGPINPSLFNGATVSQTTPGFFNLPVCQTLDLRSFPPAKPPSPYTYSK